jgi:hypothetical protein
MSNYIEEHRLRAGNEAANTVIEGCARVLYGGNGISGTPFRGNVSELSHAIARYGVWPDFPFTFATIQRICTQQADALQARGVQVVFHDDQGKDIELIALSQS